MAHITHRLGGFTGHVGPVRFVNGHAETSDPDMVDFFANDPDTYDVAPDLEDTEDEHRRAGEAAAALDAEDDDTDQE